MFSSPPQFNEQRPHHRRHGKFGGFGFGGPCPHPDFEPHGYAQDGFQGPPPHMRGHRGFKRGPPQDFGFGARGFGGERGYHRGPFDFHGPPPPPPPGFYSEEARSGGPPDFFGRGFGPCGPPPPPPPPHEFGSRDFHAWGPPPRHFRHHRFHGPPPPPPPFDYYGPPPPPPFESESEESSEEVEAKNDIVEKDAEVPTFAPTPPSDFGPRGHRGRHGHHHRFVAEPEYFESYGMRSRSFGRGRYCHGRRHGDEFAPYGFHHRGKPARAESRVLKSDDQVQVQIMRHGSERGFKHYAITYKVTDGVVGLDVESQRDHFHQVFQLKEDQVEMEKVTWEVIKNVLVITIPKSQAAIDAAFAKKVAKEQENKKKNSTIADTNMDDAATLTEKTNEKPSKKKSKKTKKAKKTNTVYLDDIPTSTSVETWSAISTPSASDDEAEGAIQIKTVGLSSRDDGKFDLRLPNLSRKSEKEKLSESETSSASDDE